MLNRNDVQPGHLEVLTVEVNIVTVWFPAKLPTIVLFCLTVPIMTVSLEASFLSSTFHKC